MKFTSANGRGRGHTTNSIPSIGLSQSDRPVNPGDQLRITRSAGRRSLALIHRCLPYLPRTRPVLAAGAIEELLPHLYGEPVLCPGSPIGPRCVVLRLPALHADASVCPPCSCPVRSLRPRSEFCDVSDL